MLSEKGFLKAGERAVFAEPQRVAEVRRSCSLPGEQFETVDTEAMSTLSLDRLPQDLVTLLALVLSFHGNSQHILRDPLEGGI